MFQGTPHHWECNMNISSSREQMMANNSKIHYSFARHRTFDGFRLHHNLKIKKPYLDILFKYEEVCEILSKSRDQIPTSVVVQITFQYVNNLAPTSKRRKTKTTHHKSEN